MLRTPHRYYAGDQIKEIEMDRLCRAYGGEERFIVF